MLSATLALITHLDVVTAPVVILFGLGQGLTTAFSTPAQQALFVSLVPREDVTSAVGLNSMTFNIARAAGPALAGATVGDSRHRSRLRVNSCSYLLFTVALVFVRPRRQERPASTRLRDSIDLLRREPRLAVALAVVAAVGFTSDPINTLAPAFGARLRPARHDRGLHHRSVRCLAVTAAFVLAGRQASAPGGRWIPYGPVGWGGGLALSSRLCTSAGLSGRSACQEMWSSLDLQALALLNDAQRPASSCSARP